VLRKKNHYWEGIWCGGRIIIGQELGATESILFYEESLKGRNYLQRKNFLFYEESLLGRKWMQRKDFLFYEESLLGRNWVQRKNHYRAGTGSK
jgi:hypothetical protein